MSSYYDIDTILADAQKIPCTFKVDVPGLGYIDGNAGGDVKKGQCIFLPLWLCGFIALQNLGPFPVVSLDLPVSLSPRVLHALKADPRTVDLRAIAPHFYELAARTLELFEEDEIVDVLSEVGCLSRYNVENMALKSIGPVLDPENSSRSNSRPCT